MSTNAFTQQDLSASKNSAKKHLVASFLYRDSIFFNQTYGGKETDFVEAQQYAALHLHFQTQLLQDDILPVKLEPMGGFSVKPLGTCWNSLLNRYNRLQFRGILDLYAWPASAQLLHQLVRNGTFPANVADPNGIYWSAEVIATLKNALTRTEVKQQIAQEEKEHKSFLGMPAKWIKACADAASPHNLFWYDIQLFDLGEAQSSSKRWSHLLSAFNRWAKDNKFECFCLWHCEFHGTHGYKYSLIILKPYHRAVFGIFSHSFQLLCTEAFGSSYLFTHSELGCLAAQNPQSLEPLKRHFASVKLIRQQLRPARVNPEADWGRFEIKRPF